MMERRGICFVRFDDKLGPTCIYSKNVEERLLKKVAMKSHLSTLSLTSDLDSTQKDFFDSIIPLPDEGYIAYSTYFFVKDNSARGGNRAFGIILLADQSQQMFFYKSIPEISANVKEIAKEIIKDGDPKRTLDIDTRHKLNELLDIENLQVEFVDSTGSLDLIKQRIRKEEPAQLLTMSENLTADYHEGSFDFLVQKMSTCLDRIIHALLSNERILVVGRHDEIIITLYTLKEFLPHRKIYNDPWMAPMADAEVLYSKTAEKLSLHILGIREESIYSDINYDERERTKQVLRYSSIDFSEFQRSFPISSKVVIDFYQGVVYGGVTNNFCVHLFESIKNTEYEDAKQIIKDKINYLIDKSNKLKDVFFDEENIKDNFIQFLSGCMKGELSLLMKFIDDINPQLHQRISSYITLNKIPLNDLS